MPWLPRRTVTPPPIAGTSLQLFLVGASFFLFVLSVNAFLGTMTLSPLTWFIARSSGLLMIVLSWLSMVTGMGLTTKLFDRHIARHILLSVHTYAFHLWYGFLLLHVASIILDPTVSYGLREAFIPFVVPTDRWWVGLGILAAELMIVVGGSAILQRVVGYPVWRRLHYLSGPAFFLGIAHGMASGTDSGHPAAIGLYVFAFSSAVMMVSYRLLRWNARSESRSERRIQHAQVIQSGH